MLVMMSQECCDALDLREGLLRLGFPSLDQILVRNNLYATFNLV